MLDRSGHNRQCDWWSFGILIYEMLSGLPPFFDSDRKKMFKKIQNANLEFPNPPFFEESLVDLLTLLLHRLAVVCGLLAAESCW